MVVEENEEDEEEVKEDDDLIFIKRKTESNGQQEIPSDISFSGMVLAGQ